MSWYSLRVKTLVMVTLMDAPGLKKALPILEK